MNENLFLQTQVQSSQQYGKVGGDFLSGVILVFGSRVTHSWSSFPIYPHPTATLQL